MQLNDKIMKQTLKEKKQNMFAWVSPMFQILDLHDLKQLLLRLSEVIKSKTFFIGHYPFSLSVFE